MPKAPMTRVTNFEVSSLDSKNEKVVLNIPVKTTAERNTIPVAMLKSGSKIFNSTLGVEQTYNTTTAIWSASPTTSDVNGYITIATGAAAPTVQAPFNTQAHTVGTLYFATTAPKLWVCSVAGAPGTWIGVNLA